MASWRRLCNVLCLFAVSSPWFCQSIDPAINARSLFARPQTLCRRGGYIPKQQQQQQQQQYQNPQRLEPIDLGTTLIAIRYQHGVVVAADTRTSVSGYVSHRFSQKIHAISPHCVVLRSGSAADTQQLVSDCSQFVQSQWYRHGVELSVAQIAHWLQCQIRNDPDADGGGGAAAGRDLSVSLLVAGYDAHSNRGKLFSLVSSGALLEEDRFAVAGSGSTYIVGYLNQELDRLTATSESSQDDDDDDDDENTRRLPTLEQAITLCQHAIQGGIQWDGGSGGFARIVILSRQGIEERTILPKPGVQHQ
ncbi:hypothetical protein ACA910_011792 [Epithemia clementina (nom. ined.)]